MEVYRGANLVGMSMLPLDAYPLSLLIKKKIYIFTLVYLLYVLLYLKLKVFWKIEKVSSKEPK